MTAVNTTTVRIPGFAIECADEYRSEIAAMFIRIATPLVREYYTPQQLMVAAAVRCGMNVDRFCLKIVREGSSDIFVRPSSGSVFGFRIDDCGDLWLTDGIGYFAE